MKFPQNITKILFILALVGILPFNVFFTMKKCVQMKKDRSRTPFYFSGHQFLGLENLFKGMEYIGYYTDKDIKLPQNNLEYSQAQFILAPSILEINNTDHKYTLFACSTDKIALEKIKALGLKPLKRSRLGIILAEKEL